MYPSLPKQVVITEVVTRINDENLEPSMNKKALTELVSISVEFMSLAQQRHQHLQNYTYKELKKFMFTHEKGWRHICNN